MGYRADSLSAAEWEGITEEQRRSLKIAYLMGANDALKICEGNIGEDIRTAELTEDLIGSMDRRLGFMPSEAPVKKLKLVSKAK